MGEKRKLKQLFSWSNKYNGTFKKIKNLKAYRESEIIHLHNIHGGYFDLACLRQIAEEKPIVWTIHDRWILTGGEAYLLDEEKYFTGALCVDSKGVYALNNPLIDARKKHLKEKQKLFEEIADNTALISPGKYVQSILERGMTIPTGIDIRTTHYGVDVGIFKNFNQRTWHKPRVLVLNTKSAFKNSAFIFREFQNIQVDIDLHTFGTKVSDELVGCPRVNHIDHGYITDRNALCDMYNEVDIFVFSTFNENFPMVSVEAAACGVLVLGSDIGPLREQSELFDMTLFQNDQSGAISSILDELGNNLAKTRERGRHAAIDVMKKLDRNDSMKSYDIIYQEILKRKQ